VSDPQGSTSKGVRGDTRARAVDYVDLFAASHARNRRDVRWLRGATAKLVLLDEADGGLWRARVQALRAQLERTGELEQLT